MQIFLGGSIGITSLNSVIIEQLTKITEQNHKIIIGDAPGADKALQRYLFEIHYLSVTVYHSGKLCRNNLGNWENIHVAPPPNVYGSAFYSVKDRRMAMDSTSGFMLWDGKSKGTLNNIKELCRFNKTCTVHLVRKSSFCVIDNDIELLQLLKA